MQLPQDPEDRLEDTASPPRGNGKMREVRMMKRHLFPQTWWVRSDGAVWGRSCTRNVWKLQRLQCARDTSGRRRLRLTLPVALWASGLVFARFKDLRCDVSGRHGLICCHIVFTRVARMCNNERPSERPR